MVIIKKGIMKKGKTIFKLEALTNTTAISVRFRAHGAYEYGWAFVANDKMPVKNNKGYGDWKDDDELMTLEPYYWKKIRWIFRSNINVFSRRTYYITNVTQTLKLYKNETIN